LNVSINQSQEKTKRKRELYVASGAALLISIIFLVESHLARSAEDIPFAGHLLIFFLLSIVILLLILMIFFLIRNIFKLVFERRRKVLGSNLKTRLTMAFVALTLIPTIVLFIASAGVLHTTIESWFTTQVEESLQSSLVVAQAYYKNASDRVMESGLRIAGNLSEEGLTSSDKSSATEKALQSWRSSERLSGIQVYYKDGGPPNLVGDPGLKEIAVPPPEPSFLKIGFQGEKTSKIIPLEGGGDLIRAVTPVYEKNKDTPSAGLITDYYIPTSLAGRLFTISNAFGDYQEAKRMRGPIKTIYILILLMVALLVILIGFWFGVTMARDITDPILSLAEGTQEIASGNLEVYIEPVGDDELSVLVRSFNKMSQDLRKSRDELIRMNIDIESRRKYIETVLKNIAAGVLALDSDYKITAVNNSARRLLGVGPRDVFGKSFSEVLPGTSAQSVSEALDELESSNSSTVERQITVSLSDRTLNLLCFASSIKDEDNPSVGAVLVLEDMTYLIKAQRMAAWRDVARRIAHEIKNPLTPIQLNAQRLRRKYLAQLGESGLVLDTCTKAIIDQVEQLKNMVNEFSKFARMPSANPKPNNINTIISETINLYSQGNEQIDFNVNLEPSIPNLDLDKEQIKRAMVNLLDNAVSACSKKGEVCVATRFDKELSMASVEIKDNGSGIDPTDRDRVFEPYFSRKLGGTGLGLTIVSTIVSDHNGFIRVRENPGGGTIFTIEFPVRKT
jgi:two-component system, NtrC family, nitrogen regulation sensor histidine kinase NtrY